MKVDLSKMITGFNGDMIKDEKGAGMTIADVFMSALATSLKKDEDEPGKDRIHRYNLGKEVYLKKTEKMDLNTDDVVMLKSRIKDIFLSPIIYGSICEELGDVE